MLAKGEITLLWGNNVGARVLMIELGKEPN